MTAASVALLPMPPRPDAALPVAERVRAMLALGRTWVGQTEHPPGSNRGPLPDLLADALGEPRGLAWCARAAGVLRRWARLWVPPRDVGNCDAWRYYAEQAGLWRAQGALPLAQPPAGSVVLYTTWRPLESGPYAGGGRSDAVHAGLLLPTDDRGRPRGALEGNTSARDFDARGGAMVAKPVHRPAVYGYVLPA